MPCPAANRSLIAPTSSGPSPIPIRFSTSISIAEAVLRASGGARFCTTVSAGGTGKLSSAMGIALHTSTICQLSDISARPVSGAQISVATAGTVA